MASRPLPKGRGTQPAAVRSMSIGGDIPVLETERLRLRAWREEDHNPYADFCANEATAGFMGGVCSREDAWRRMAVFLGHWHLRGYGNWVLEDKASGDWVGYSGLWRPDGWPEPEVMWGLAVDAQGRGYATEAAQRARAFAYDELGWTTVISCIAPENLPSQRVAQRLGAKREGAIELRGSTVGIYRHPGRDIRNRNLQS
jgi:RimJ/RimL family protein N-acetyltransferase